MLQCCTAAKDLASIEQPQIFTGSACDQCSPIFLLRVSQALFAAGSLCSHVYTNPALVSPQGQLLVTPHHTHPCKTCPVNMCKRIILQQHLQAMKDSAGVQTMRVVYIGDGGNDLCPAQSLGPDDFVMARAGYALDKMLQDPAVHATIKARVHRWNGASDILDALSL